VAVEWEGAPAVAGEWTIDAAPRFSEIGGRFVGYAGRFRRPPPPSVTPSAGNPQADRMRQLLHELKTPVNAIQGFAEVIQQQLFGPTPHEYRALAATIAGDAARMLAGFDELDRLARLESGALALDEVLQSRGARFVARIDSTPSTVMLSASEAEALGWRLLATVTGAAGPGEALPLDLTCHDRSLSLKCALPVSLAAHDDIFAADNRAGGGAVSAGMFGAGFALRLARAEARAAGGDLVRQGAMLTLTLPRLTSAGAVPSHAVGGAAHG
jgi:hypothetical protein